MYLRVMDLEGQAAERLIVAEFPSLPVKVEEDERFLSIKDLNNREIVAVSKDGEDYYYPDGYIEIDFDYLNKYQK